MDADFPAAHSMDTMWFAVDKDGRVACFDSGEAGAVPAGAFAGDPAYSALRRLGKALPPTEVLHDRQGRSRPGEGTGLMDHLARHGTPNYPVLMFLKSLDLVRDEIAAGRAREVRSTSDFAVWFHELDGELARRLHEEDVCLGCYFHFGMDEEEEDEGGRVRAASRGMYQYSHTCENWIAGPYGRTGIPANPVHIDQLPPALRNQIKEMRFDVNFAETPYIQPVQHTECASWETRWLDLDGNEHPMPGREGDEDENLEEFLENLGGEGDTAPGGEE